LDAALTAGRPDVILEATGAASLVLAAMGATSAYGLTCLTGVSPVGRRVEWDAGGLNRSIVLENDAVFGSVNANLEHYHAAADALTRADGDWLARLVTRRVPLASATDALAPDPEGVKTVITLQD
jgi:threonine dehydrogenase-like Zn-dependent dehydrogenase